MKEQITALRQKIDALSKIVSGIAPNGAPLINGSSVALIMSKAWLGKALGELGVDTPYKNDGNRKSINDIEPTADTSSIENHFDALTPRNTIEWIDYARQEIEKVSDEIKNIPTQGLSREFAICRTNSWNLACEARMLLGFYLEFLRNNG